MYLISLSYFCINNLFLNFFINYLFLNFFFIFNFFFYYLFLIFFFNKKTDEYYGKGIVVSIGMNHWSSKESFKILLNSITFLVSSNDWNPSSHKYLSKNKKQVVETFFLAMMIRKKRDPKNSFIPKVILHLIIKCFVKSH